MIAWLSSTLLAAAVATAPQAPQNDAQAPDPAAVLPVPPAVATGEVPLSRPIAPIPEGLARWAFDASVLFGVADPFYGKVTPMISARRGFGALGVEVFVGKAFSWADAALSICTTPTSCTSPSGSQLGATPGNLGFMGGVAGVWRAAEGKASLAGIGNHRFGLDFSLGAAALQYTVTETTTHSNVAPAARFGLAFETELFPSFGLRAEFQDLVYPTVIRGEHDVQNQALVGFAFAWRLGGS